VIRILLAGTAAVAVFAGCAHSPTAENTPRTTTAAPEHDVAGGMAGMCPMSVAGTHVSATDAVNGEALTFTTTGQVAELRARVRGMAEAHNRHHADPGAHEGMMGSGMAGAGHPVGSTMMPPSWATVMDVEGGASIVLAPNAAADLDKLQSAVRARAQRLEQNGCGMMGQTRGG
jgi:hypothetical protein